MRKRIRSEPYTANLSFLTSPALLSGNGCDNGPTDQLKPQNKHPADNFVLEVPHPNNYGHPETGFENEQHAFPELMRVDSAAINVSHQSYHAGHVGSVENETLDGTSHKDCLFGFTGNISSAPCDEAECNNGNQSFEHNFQQRDFPNILGENLISVDTSSDVHEISQSNVLGTSNRYKNDDLGAKPLSGFDSSNNNHEGVCSDFMRNNNLSSHVHEISQSNVLGTSSPYKNDDIGTKPLSGFDSSNNNHEGLCSDFEENNNLSSHVPDCSGSFHQLGYSSPPPCMPIWRTMEDISTPTMPLDGHYRDKDQGLLNMDDHRNIDAPGCDVASSEPELDDGMSGAGLNNPTIMPENDFMDFSDTYMDFADGEDLLFIDVDEKDDTDRPCLGLSSTLLSSPCDTHHDVANSNDLGTTNVLETCLGIPDAACSGDPNVLDEMHSGLHNDHNASVSGVNMLSTSSRSSNTAEPLQEFMICVLNTEDLEIPNNDHVILPAQAFSPFSSNLEQFARESTGLFSTADDLSTDGRCLLGDLNIVKEQAANLQPTVSSLLASSSSLPKLGVLDSCDGCAVEAELSKGGSIAEGSKYAGSGVDEPKTCKSETVILNSSPVAALKEESTDLTFQNQDNPDTSFASFLENHLQETDDAKPHPLNATDSYPEEANMRAALQTCLLPHSDQVPAEVGFSDTVAIMSTSDQEEQFSDSEDVPYFSDIEALILDMDLGPYDEESCLFSKEASRYQHTDTKSTIRWEQGFHSHINRSISSHGAFAVFYGRHLKYFIKDPEVLIGRETKDLKVDIDLGREGRANKISRRQAIIKMDEEGAFSLKNIGKFSIFVNGKEVPAKKRINLLSHCLVKIQDMHFAFEVNESAVWRYIKTLRRSSQEQGTFRFDWKPDQNP